MNKEYCVYVHIFPNGKVYVGQTKQKPKYRFNSGEGYKGCRYVYSAIKKYGWGNIEHKILKDNLSEDEANYWENYYIAEYKSQERNLGYNLRSGGTSGYKYSEDARQRMSEKNKGRKQPESEKKKRADSLKKYYETHEIPEEVRAKLRKPNKGQFKAGVSHEVSEETREKISKALTGRTGRPLTDDQKKYLSDIQKGRKRTPEQMAHLEPYQFKKGHPASDKSIAKLRKKLSKKVCQYDLEGNLLNVYESITEASRGVGLSPNAVGNAVRGYSKTTGGYVWRYASGDES